MLLKYFYDARLAHASYLVGCQATGEAIVVDPGRDVAPYREEARAQGMRLVAATETHIHADFVSGARQLAEETGARLYLSGEGGADWSYRFAAEYDHCLLHDGDSFMVGNLRFEALHTPGHTPEHISLLLYDARATEPMGLFSGDFVFVGDVGRPDLLEKAAGVAGSAERGARQMFHSLQRFKALPEYLQVWPAHGAGSACGRALGAIPSTTVGYEKRFNWALRHEDEEAFVQELLTGQPESPLYFKEMKRVNREGPPVLTGSAGLPLLATDQFVEFVARGELVVDTRAAASYARGHVPGTINIPYGGSFTTWAGWLLPYDRPFYLLADPAQNTRLTRDLLSIGLDNAAGIFDECAVSAWEASGGTLQSYDTINPESAAALAASGEIVLLDVRNQAEWQEGHIPGAIHTMLGYLPQRLAALPAERPVVVHCQSGVRSAIAVSILQAHGIADVSNMVSGMTGWEGAGLPTAREGA